MPLDIGFTDFIRSYRLLSSALDRRSANIFRAIRELSSDRLLGTSKEQLLKDVMGDLGGSRSSIRSNLFVAAQPEQITQDRGIRVSLAAREGPNRYPCLEFQAPFSWTGPTDIFGTWPDKANVDLATFPEARGLGPAPCVVWEFGEPHSLIAWVDVPWAEGELEPAHPVEKFQELAGYLVQYCEAVNHQADTWAVAVLADVTVLLEEQRKVAARARGSRDFANAALERFRTPKLEFESVTASVSTGRDLRDNDHVMLPPMLTDSSFADVVNVINRWVDAVEKYPSAFVELEEERLSDLLAATLNGAFGRTEREVFVRRGKTDIYLQSSAVGRTGLPDTIAGELKIWQGRKSLLEALQQAAGNMTQRMRSSIVVVVVKERKSFAEIERRGMALLVDESIDAISTVKDRPVLSLRATADRVQAPVQRIAVIFVDLTLSDREKVGLKGGRRSP